MSGWFELHRNDKGHFHFVLKAGNAETILSSQVYRVKRSALKGIASVQTNGLDDARFERKTAKNGKPYFDLKAANHQVIGTSQMYSTEAHRDVGIASVKTNAASKQVKEVP
jgi:uncharacterized protein YegP (UPF0339 family)